MMMQSIPTSSVAGPDSGPLLGEPTTELPFDPQIVDAMSDEELDELTHGVIALDARGRILRYNLAEANLARLDRHSVIGRLFFDEVAPCTKTEAFFGEFSRMVEQGGDRVARFGYLLDFKFGAQECDVEMVKAASASRYYVFVTRRRFADPRSGLPDGWAAPLQSELDAEGHSVGVVRDPSGSRMALVETDFLAALFTTARAAHPIDWPQLAYAWGQKWGRRWVVGTEMNVLQDEQVTLGELPFSRTVQHVRARLAEAGWGSLRVSTEYASSGVLVADLSQSLLADLRKNRSSSSERTEVESVMEGLLGAVFSHLAGKKLAAVSVQTEEKGSSRFLIVGESFRSVAVAIASARGAGDLDGMMSVLRSATSVVQS